MLISKGSLLFLFIFLHLILNRLVINTNRRLEVFSLAEGMGAVSGTLASWVSRFAFLCINSHFVQSVI